MSFDLPSMSFDLFEIACDQRAEVRALASTYVARYGVDALSLACMARADVLERGRHARAALYDQAIKLLAFRDTDNQHLRAVSSKLRMTINDTSQVVTHVNRPGLPQQHSKLLQLSRV